MTPSPDDIFAAQLWPWPDPALKRDAQGRVLFVNHAFLQLFGGQIDQWRGQTIEGWHTPSPGGGLNRFEIRIPANGATPEQIYDWVEQTDRNGFAFAMARNVTDLLASHETPPPGAEAPPPAQHEVTPEAAPAAEVQSPPVTPPSEPDPIVATTAQPAASQPASPAAAVEPSPQPAPEPAPVAASNAPEPAPVASATPAQDTSSQPAPATPDVTVQAEEAPRDFERRALPIENGDAVLGNNWRDAVIAKAVGAEDEDAEADAEEAAPPPAPKSGDAVHILLAEDNAINALLTRTLLEAEGHIVETVEDGQLAVEAMKTQSFDLIFMDMRMPNMDGLEATRNIRRLPNVPSDLPIIALTANAFDDDRNACFDSGMNDFMTKPVSAEELSEMVTRWTAKTEAEAQRMAS